MGVTLLAIVATSGAWGMGCKGAGPGGGVPVTGRTTAATGGDVQGEAPPRRTEVRVFYSGHSLTDGVPDAVALIAGSLGDRFEFESQSLEGSLLRQRTKGEDAHAPLWPGYRQGRNRAGSGLDVAATLSGHSHDFLIATERHDLPYAAQAEGTAEYLRHLHDRLIEGNPSGKTLLYHAWLALDRTAPQVWIDYERRAVMLWACVAAKVNLTLEADGRADRVGLAPGGTALVGLVERALRGEVRGLPGATPVERLAAIFRDRVHLTPLGVYFMGAVHYGTLFGRSPEGGALPPQIDQVLGAELQRLAWAEARAFHATWSRAAVPTMDSCRLVAAGLCRPFHAVHFSEVSLLGRLKREKSVRSCTLTFEDASDARNPFRWPDPSFRRWPKP